jgi:hypothetical protein
MTCFRTTLLALLLALSAGLFSARAEKPVEDIAAIAAENAVLKSKVDAMVAVQAQCLDAVQQFRNARKAGND